MYKIILKIVIFLTLSRFVYSSCNLNTNNLGPAIIIKAWGSREIMLTQSNRPSILVLAGGENITVFCPDFITFRRHYESKISPPKLTVNCQFNPNHDYILTARVGEDNDNYDYSNDDAFTCESVESLLTLYESSRLLPNCEPSSSLAIGVNLASYSFQAFAGLCYDWNTQELNFANYIVYRDRSLFVKNGVELSGRTGVDSVDLDIKLPPLNNFFTFLSQQDFYNNLETLQLQHPVLRGFTFEYANLIQDPAMHSYMDGYSMLFKTIWWSNLRTLNWRTFLDLLERRSKVVQYNAFVGKSGVMTLPNMNKKCQTTEEYNAPTFSIPYDGDKTMTAPAYIWMYLESLGNEVKEEFVVIGYNSPFYVNKEWTNLCQDVCDEIEWMRPFDDVRRMPTLGAIICCHPGEVSLKLDNFPIG